MIFTTLKQGMLLQENSLNHALEQTMVKKIVTNAGVDIWNSIPQNIRQSASKTSFAKALYFTNKKKLYCTIQVINFIQKIL